ncbi:MAG: hypothetical protein ACOYMA_06200 [Bacteroidia bacterium]
MKTVDGYKMVEALFSEIKGEGYYMTKGYTYLGWGGINSTPEDKCVILVNHESKVWKIK